MRVWSLEKKTWLTDFFLTETGEVYTVVQDKGLCKVSKVIVTFFTGIRDLNKKKVYEDDIIRMNDIVGVVKYIAPSFVLATRDGFYPLSSANENEIEILGNIYEHPSLFFEWKLLHVSEYSY